MILRLLYYTFPDILWAFVYVDDYVIILPTYLADTLTMQIITFLHAIGLPISWKKVTLSDPNTWLGYLVTTRPLRACLSPDKQTIISNTLLALQSEVHMDLNTMRTTAGRLNWATMIYDLLRPFLQPIFAWVAAMVKRSETQRWGVPRAVPPKRVRTVATTLLRLFSELPPEIRDARLDTTIIAASDAGARTTTPHGTQMPDHEAIVGGWYGPPTQHKHDKH